MKEKLVGLRGLVTAALKQLGRKAGKLKSLGRKEALVPRPVRSLKEYCWHLNPGTEEGPSLLSAGGQNFSYLDLIVMQK